ncbi:uncharacterized protein LOC134543299 [Bacillus rossius redtenbacheri]|uniref:uncharacterized protein LOC134543299 n=1 Tax=Bacillus rossius redtenbacheri TaxID=93214 RepID=UPI002FDE3EB8
MAAVAFVLLLVSFCFLVHTGAAISCIKCGDLFTFKKECGEVTNKANHLVECDPDVTKCYSMITPLMGKVAVRGCYTDDVKYFCNAFGACEKCSNDFCNGKSNLKHKFLKAKYI